MPQRPRRASLNNSRRRRGSTKCSLRRTPSARRSPEHAAAATTFTVVAIVLDEVADALDPEAAWWACCSTSTAGPALLAGPSLRGHCAGAGSQPPARALRPEPAKAPLEEGGRRMNGRASSLAHYPNLRGRARDDFRAAAIAADQASDADGLAAVPHLWPSEGAAVLDPDHHGEASRVRVVHADVEKRRRASAGRGKPRSGNASTDGRYAADSVPGVLPRDRATATDGARRRESWLLSSRASAPGRYRSDYEDKGGGLPQVDPFRLMGTQFHRSAVEVQEGQVQVGSSNTRPRRPLLRPPTLVIFATVTTGVPSVALSSTARRARSSPRGGSTRFRRK